jgi:hypothetical protein
MHKLDSKITWIARAPAYLLLIIAGCCNVSAATIIGSVSDTNGNLLAGAQVHLTPLRSGGSPNGPAVSPLSASPAFIGAVSSIGQFEFDNVAPGHYSLCAVPNDQTHINSCSSPFGGAETVNVSANDTLIQSNLSASMGVPILLTTVLAQNSSKVPTNVFLDVADGRFFPMQNDEQPGHFWVVVPPQIDLKVVTFVAGGQVSLPSETVHAGATGVPVAITVTR